jgi:uncharacterized membrane protein (UPF0182 family)
VALGVVLLGAGTAASYYVDALWFESPGLASVFWSRLSLEASTFAAFALATFFVVYGVFRLLKPDLLDDVIASTLLINRRPMRLPIDRFLKLIGFGTSLALAAIIGSSMAARWMTLALYWRAPRSADMLDPIFQPVARLLSVHCVRFRRFAPTMTFRISTLIDTRSVVPCAR